MLEGLCPDCKIRFYGWALNNPRNQLCVKCGCTLEVRQNDILIRSRYSPFRTEEYKVALAMDNWGNHNDQTLVLYFTRN